MHLPDQVRSHLRSGVVAEIEAPELNLRTQVIRSWLTTNTPASGWTGALSDEVIMTVATRSSENLRELVGLLRTLRLRLPTQLDTVTVPEMLGYMRAFSGNPKQITFEMIKKAVADHYGLRVADLESGSRTRSIARPRQVSMWLAKQLTTRSLPEMGRRLGDRDHTTILHGVRRIEKLRFTNHELQRDLTRLLHQLR